MNVQHTKQVKLWTRELFELDDATTVMVSELACSEPDCPPLETVIAILRASSPVEQHKIHLPLSAISRDDVARLRTRNGALTHH